mgnify:FL=1
MRLIRLLATCLVLSGAFVAPLAGAMDIATYDAQRKAPANSPVQVRLRVYLLGVGEGLKLANFHLVERNEPALFCLPETTPLFAEDYLKLIDAALKEARGTLERQQVSVENILLGALRQAHACPVAERPRAAAPASEPGRAAAADSPQVAAPVPASVPTR